MEKRIEIHGWIERAGEYKCFVSVVFGFVVYLSGGIWKLGKALKAVEFTQMCIFSSTGSDFSFGHLMGVCITSSKIYFR